MRQLASRGCAPVVRLGAFVEKRARSNGANSDRPHSTGGTSRIALLGGAKNDKPSSPKKKRAAVGRAFRRVRCSAKNYFWIPPLWQSAQVRSGSSSPPGCLKVRPFALSDSRSFPLPCVKIVWHEVQSLDRTA